MSHPEQIEFIEIVRSRFPEFFQGARVLEIGSLDINGSIRSLFSNCDYIGLDIAPGKGVNVVCEGQAYDAPDGSFDIAISCEAMEHNPYWAETLVNMFRLARPGGLVVMSCATVGRKEHGTSRFEPESSPLTVNRGWNYYRNLTRQDIVRGVDLSPLAVWDSTCNWKTYDLYFLGMKATTDFNAISAARDLIGEFKSIYEKRKWSSFLWLRRAARAHLKHVLFGQS